MPAFAPQEQAAYALRPLEIQPTVDGYLLREKAPRIAKPKSSPTIAGWIVGIVITGLFLPHIALILVGVFGARLILPFFNLTNSAVAQHTKKDQMSYGWLAFYICLWGLLVTGASFFLSPSSFLNLLYIGVLGVVGYFSFGIIYWSLRLLVDRQTRQRLGFKWGLDELEIIFSHYPPQLGDGDRLTIRRRLKETVWTRLFHVDGFPKDSQINVDLVCIERVTYTQGTDLVTDMTEVYRQSLQITPLIPGNRQISCHFDLTIPPHLAPSLEGTRNQIRWLLNVIETYPNLLENKISYLTFVVDP
jgi:hypothetical protein